ncbi:MAG: HDOD domain-containing protein [Pseudomonadota bacterium]
MAPPDSPLFPLVEVQPAANVQNAWVALTLRVGAIDGTTSAGLLAIFSQPDLLAAVAPLHCIVLLDSPSVMTDTLRTLMPPNRVSFAFKAAGLADEGERKRMQALHDAGYRVMLDGRAPDGIAVPPTLRGQVLDCSAGAPGGDILPAVFGPHLARGIGKPSQLMLCAAKGFEWFSGDYPLHPAPSPEQQDGSSRKRLLNLLGLLLSDAENRDIEAELKQDPGLTYHLMKLANSAAFAHSTAITTYNQAISVLGRRQLQRWLQLLLYARQQPDGLANPLLPIAALRASQMEALCKARGGDRDDQDLAFMTGVFSLLDVLFEMPMDDIVTALKLVPDAADALLRRAGPLGDLLELTESAPVADAQLAMAGITPAQWWQTQLHAYHWAIQVSRNL